MADRETAKAQIPRAQSVVTSVLTRSDVPPLRALYCPKYPKELLGEVIQDSEKNYLITLKIPKWGYGTYKRRGPKNRAIPPEVDVKTLEAVFTLFLPTPFQAVAVRNSLENVVIFINVKEDNYEQIGIESATDAGSGIIL